MLSWSRPVATQPPANNEPLPKKRKPFLARGWYLLIGVAIVVLAIIFRREVFPIIDETANTASVVGLLVSVVGFALTVWTVYETQRVSQEAQLQIEKEVAAARKETRQAVEKIALQLLQAEIEGSYRLITEARLAIQDGRWSRAAEKCQDARQSVVRLAAYRHLGEQERLAYVVGAENLQLTIGFMERNRMKPNAPAGLPSDKLQPLDTLLTQLERTRARLLQLLLEIPYAD
jgi:hypothetical protein